MATYNEISLINIPSTREGGVTRNFEFRLLERDALADDLPFDIEGPVEIQHGGQSDDILKPVKTSQALFRIKTESALAGKLIDAGSRQFYLTIRETVQNVMKFEGYIEPNFHQYDVFESVQTVQLKATGGLGTFGTGDATAELKTLKSVFTAINTELELTRDTDFYMRTRYDGQALSDPVPERIWMTELGKLGEESGKRQAAVQQICQEFNLQIFQHNGKLVVADVYERFKNHQAANVYRNGTTQETEDLLITLDETNVIDTIENADHHPTGQKEIRIGRVVQQRRLPQRKESAFPAQTLPQNLTSVPTVIEYPGDFVGGDILKIDEIYGTSEITPGYMPETYPNTITVDYEILQFEFIDKDTQESLYFDFENGEWSALEKWGNYPHQFFHLSESQQTDGYHYRPFTWSFPSMELAAIPEDRRGTITIRLKEDYTISQPGVDVDPGYMDTSLTNFWLRITFNDTPDPLYHQAITTNAPGEPRVFPLFESDFTDYAGESGTMYIGAAGDVYANNLWIEEGTANLLPFIELTAKRKAEILLGSADRIYLKVRDLTPISLLNVLSFQGKNYAPVGIVEELFTGFQHVWMKPAPFLEYSYEEQFTYDPEEVTATQNGPSRSWVDSRIGDGFQSALGVSAIAKTTAATGSGLVTAFQIDRQNLLVTGDEIYIVDPFTLNRYEFTVSADQGASFTLTVEPKSVPGPIPTGSFIFPRGNVTSGVLRSRYATQIFSDFAGVGILREAVDGVVSSLPLHLFVKVRAGWTMKLINEDTGIVFTWTADGTEGQFYEGSVDVPLKQPQLIQAPAESRITLGNTMLSAFFHVDPGQILGKVEREAKADAIGTLSADRSGAGVTTIALQDIDEDVQLTDGQKLRILNKEGRNEEIVVNGDQLIVAPADTLNIVSKDLSNNYVAGYAWVREATYKITGRLNITAGLTVLNQQNTQENTDALAGLTLDVQDNESAIATLQAQVTTTQNDISGLENEDTQLNAAILDLEADLNSATASFTASIDILEDDTRTIIRSNSAPTQRPSGDPLEAGDLWIETDDNDEAHQWDGNSWEPFDGKVKSQVAGLILQVGDFDTDDFQQFEDQIGTIGARTVLFAKADGNIAEINLLAGSVGDLITISADQVNINGVVFDEGAGLIRSTDFSEANETGWRLLGGSNSLLQVHNAEIWGTLKTVDLEEEMIIQGAIYMPTKSDPNIVISAEDGIKILESSIFAAQRSITWEDAAGSDVGRIWSDSDAFRFESFNRDIFLRSFTGDIELFSQPGTITLYTDTILLQADHGIEADSPIRLQNLTTTGMNNISNPQQGMIVYNTTIDDPVFFDGSVWRSIIDGDDIL